MYVKMLHDTTEDVRRHEGRYPFVSISQFSVHGFWGTGALSSISERLQKKLPGLRGFSERNLKYMRTFYEEWSPLLEFAYEDSAEASAEFRLSTIRAFPEHRLLSPLPDSDVSERY